MIEILTFTGKVLTFMGKMLTTNNLNDDHNILVDILFFNDDDHDVKTLGNFNIGITNSHL